MRAVANACRVAVLSLCAAVAAVHGASADGDPAHGVQVFRVCSACHSLRPDLNMTGPSLAGVWGRKAGSLSSFERYSPALKASGVVWDATTLDAWLRNPSGFIPGTWMTFKGIADDAARGDLIAFLKAASERRNGSPGIDIPAAYMEPPMNLKQLPAAQQVKAIRACHDSYFVTTADGGMRAFWDQSLRFETDASELGPADGAPVILPSGMFGDRAIVVFATSEEIGRSIKHQC